jgi:hypothetical protein
MTFPLMATFSVLAAALWFLDPKQDARNYLPATTFMAITLTTAWLLRGNEIFAFCLVQFVALAFFFVGSARVVAETAPCPSQ